MREPVPDDVSSVMIGFPSDEKSPEQPQTKLSTTAAERGNPTLTWPLFDKNVSESCSLSKNNCPAGNQQREVTVDDTQCH